MSVLLEFSIFPMDKGESVSGPVSQVIKLIRDSGVSYQLTPMGTVIESETTEQALELVKQSSELLQQLGARRIYSSIKLDIRQGEMGRLAGKIHSVENRIGTVSTNQE
ncbi:MAG: MTH1187 family thiamine-binding protein [Candidatus Thiodiazotropha sp. (ex Monitilora ramsayi)]|nr:MTH1187 family thiamine-binding protein [Candidatus Thiodiazotropha sp. (ex Monitilora ramsayi)]